MTEHHPDRVSAKCVAVFRKACPRARPEGSCSNKNIERDDDSKKRHHALAVALPPYLPFLRSFQRPGFFPNATQSVGDGSPPMRPLLPRNTDFSASRSPTDSCSESVAPWLRGIFGLPE